MGFRYISALEKKTEDSHRARFAPIARFAGPTTTV